MTDLPAYLDAVQARADEATPEPWDDDESVRRDGTCVVIGNGLVRAMGATPADAAFIAAARTDVPAMVAAFRAVVVLHQRTETWCETRIDAATGDQEDRALYDDAGELVAAMDGVEAVCSECAPRMGQPWPCPTIRALSSLTPDTPRSE